jgi:transposase
MRYELTDIEWTAIEPMLPNKPRGVGDREFRDSDGRRRRR